MVLSKVALVEDSYDFLSLVLDSIAEHIVVINQFGEIKYVNKSWSEFGDNNSSDINLNSDDNSWIGTNYIEECDKASEMGDEFGSIAGKGIKSVIEEVEKAFYFEYPCHSPQKNRWFAMRVTPLQIKQEKYFVISHQDITERKLSEEKIMSLAHLDGLTNIPNRRAFDEFLDSEWKRCFRLNKPISLAIIDIDYFKQLNDTYGHQFGDESLIKISALLAKYVNRPSDFCARYGGEEFVLVWGDTSLSHSLEFVNDLLQKIAQLQIPYCEDATNRYLTVSIGLAVMTPSNDTSETELISQADSMLYQAKRTGRNKISYEN